MIDNKVIQTFLKTEGYYAAKIDGIFGPISYAASRACLTANRIGANRWENSRVFIGINQLFLNKVNDAGLVVDGLYGQKTSDALYAYTTGLLNVVSNTWPKQSDVRAGVSMFGKPGTNQGTVQCPYLMYGDYERKYKVTQFQAHSKVAKSLERILTRTLQHYGQTQIRNLNLDIFSGCYNYRSTTGSSTLSLHAWGAAIDIDAAHNQMDEGAGEAAFAKQIYAPFIGFFEEEGWVSLGHARNYDWMHFQAARL
jgi:hypothetical protein